MKQLDMIFQWFILTGGKRGSDYQLWGSASWNMFLMVILDVNGGYSKVWDILPKNIIHSCHLSSVLSVFAPYDCCRDHQAKQQRGNDDMTIVNRTWLCKIIQYSYFVKLTIRNQKISHKSWGFHSFLIGGGFKHFFHPMWGENGQNFLPIPTASDLHQRHDGGVPVRARLFWPTVGALFNGVKMVAFWWWTCESYSSPIVMPLHHIDIIHHRWCTVYLQHEPEESWERPAEVRHLRSKWKVAVYRRRAAGAS